MLPGDFEAVAEVDASAFEPLWQNSLEALSRAYAQRAYATVAETSQRLVGYQISTSNPIGAHLARLAVRPETQRTGVGIALVRDLLLQFQHRGRPHITVNTQSDNLSSQALYERLGFVRTGEQFPVFVYPVQSLQ
jgi:ribosomal protein S18 acetylase RimI-like enzyme